MVLNVCDDVFACMHILQNIDMLFIYCMKRFVTGSLWS
jgi:hypothetical protein